MLLRIRSNSGGFAYRHLRGPSYDFRVQMMKRLRRLIDNRDGVAAIEFAVAAPIVTLSIAGLIEISMVMFISSLLEGGIRDASRFGITGYVPPGTTREQQIRKLVGDATVGLIDMATTIIDTKVYPSFGDVGQPEPYTDSNGNGHYDAGEPFTDVNGNGQWDPDMGAAGLGGPGDIVVYTVTADWRLMTPLLVPLMGTGGHMSLSASVAVRNEPF
jgi:Flp pilus assembly protein TadG